MGMPRVTNPRLGRARRPGNEVLWITPLAPLPEPLPENAEAHLVGYQMRRKIIPLLSLASLTGSYVLVHADRLRSDPALLPLVQDLFC